MTIKKSQRLNLHTIPKYKINHTESHRKCRADRCRSSFIGFITLGPIFRVVLCLSPSFLSH